VTVTARPARRLWEAVEPLHAVVYFTPGPVDALKALGLKGFWMTYFAGRFAPLGRVGPGPATAMAFGFAPRMVARSLPDAWAFAPPDACLAARVEAAAGELRRAFPGADAGVLAELDELLGVAVGGCRPEGRPLAAAWLAVPPPDDLHARVWLRATVLREHRGDGHVAAAVSLGLRGLDTTLTLVGTGDLPRDVIQPHRGWTDDEWDESHRRLQDRGLLDGDGLLTGAGDALRHGLEDTTDRLAAGPVEALGRERTRRLIELATPLARQLVDAGDVPVPNPVGAPRP
jgi:hypothetical protein